MSIVTTNNENYLNIANAIRQKNKMQTTYKPSEMSNAILNLECNVLKDINFFNFDGKLLFSYTFSEIASLNTLPIPANPDGLIFQQWNYTLDELKNMSTYTEVGATYITDDNSTRIYIKILDNNQENNVPLRSNITLYIQQNISNGIEINWGDNTEIQTIDGTGAVSTSHYYSNAGEYVISLSSVNNCTLSFGNLEGTKNIFGDPNTLDISYANMITKIEIGNNVKTIGYKSLSYCYSLEYITIPNNVTTISTGAFMNDYALKAIVLPYNNTSIGNNSFSYCYGLKKVILPKNTTTFGSSSFSYCTTLNTINIPYNTTIITDNLFSNCYSLNFINIPSTVTEIKNNAFYYCYNLKNIIIPNSVLSIGDSSFGYCYSLCSLNISNNITTISGYAFYYCYSLTSITVGSSIETIGNNAFSFCKSIKEYHFSSETPPILQGSSVFNQIALDCIIYVPTNSVDLYKQDTNWTVVADYIQGDTAL